MTSSTFLIVLLTVPVSFVNTSPDSASVTTSTSQNRLKNEDGSELSFKRSQENISDLSSIDRSCSMLPVHICFNGTLKRCVSEEDILHLLPATTQSEDGASMSAVLHFLNLLQQQNGCPAFDVQPILLSSAKPSAFAVWGYGLLFVTLISFCSLGGVVILPLLSKDVYQVALTLFQGLAVGSLVASSLFHLIPQTFKLVGQDKDHSYLWRTLLIFVGIYLFYVSERFMKMFVHLKRTKKQCKSTFPTPEDASFLKTQNDLNNLNGVISCKTLNVNGTTPGTNENHTGHSHDYKMVNLGDGTHQHNEAGEVGTVAWMVILGDALHNFIDGLSIGAAFSESVLAGISISLAVICEELPHELGDFAVLLGAGMRLRQAVIFNFLSALTCFLGLALGVLLGDLAHASPYIFALAAGMFLYIALVDMMEELNVGLAAARSFGLKKELQVFFIQNVGLLSGVAVLFLMARYQDHFTIAVQKPGQ